MSREIPDLYKALGILSRNLELAAKEIRAIIQDTATQETVESENIQDFFPPDLRGMLIFEHHEDAIIVRPREYLGSDLFQRISAIVRDKLQGDYVSAGRDSHFRIPRKQQPPKPTPQKQATPQTTEQIPTFDTANLVKADWKGKKIEPGKYEKAKSWGGFVFHNDLNEETLKVLERGPLTIGDYTYKMTDRIVQRNKVKK